MMIARRLLSLAIILVLLVTSVPAFASDKGFVVLHGSREEARVALTVDDCYNIDNVVSVLDLCEKYNIAVTFFVVGKVMQPEDREVWQRALDLGCEIGNHTWSHRKLSNLSAQQVKRQLILTEEAVDAALGYHYPMQMMRPPYGSLSNKTGYISEGWMNKAISQCGYLKAVKWDVSQTDAKKAFKDVKNGSILLYHAKSKDVACLDALIPQLHAAGYTCVTVSQMMGYKNPVPVLAEETAS